MYWMKDDGMFYHAGNITLNFTPVTTDDDGTYQCFASNKAGLHPSPKYILRVNCECCRKHSIDFTAI